MSTHAEEQVSYATLDVFALERFKGNPVAVVKVGEDCTLSQQQKQKIAREFNFSETVFLHHAGPNQSPHVDIFTPVNEMEFAGHPIIGTGHLLFRQLFASTPDHPNHLSVVTKAGPVAIQFDQADQLVSAEVPHNIHVHQREATLAQIRKVQATLQNAPLVESEDTYPVVSVVKGVTYVLMNLTERPDIFGKLVPGESPRLVLDEGWTPSFAGIMYYRLLGSSMGGETMTWMLRVRMMAIGLEDPACGSGCCALGAYIALSNCEQSRLHRFYIDQGSEMGRDSRIIVDVFLAEERDRVLSVKLAGHAVFVAEGKIFVK